MALLLCTHLGRRHWHLIWRLILGTAALILLYHDSYLPGISQIMAQKNNLQEFSFNYVLNFLWDFVSLPMIFSFCGVLLDTFFLRAYIRVTSVIFLIFAWLGATHLYQIINPEKETEEIAAASAAGAVCQTAGTAQSGDIPPMTDVPNSRNIESYVTRFFEAEAGRRTAMPDALAPGFVPFDIIILNVCSLSRDDIRYSHLENHPVFEKFDLAFEHFNGATSYSVPASLRLLRASCGQQTESEMYSGRRPECELLNNLAAYGFSTSVFLDHNGVYGDYLASLKSLAGLVTEPREQDLLKIAYRSFDGSPVYSDAALFDQYMNTVAKRPTYGNVSFFNLISLHDGNHGEEEKRTTAYEPRLSRLLDDLDRFTDSLEASRRNVLFILVPEHGAAIQGDKMQIDKLREIPTDRITELPVYVRFFGKERQEKQIRLQGHHSYLALSEIIARAIGNNMYSPESGDIRDHLEKLPETAPVTESTNAFFIRYRDRGYFKLKGGDWAPYVY